MRIKTKERNMENLPFAVWMTFYPLVSSISQYVGFISDRNYSDNVLGITAAINILIWIIVGLLLYEN